MGKLKDLFGKNARTGKAIVSLNVIANILAPLSVFAFSPAPWIALVINIAGLVTTAIAAAKGVEMPKWVYIAICLMTIAVAVVLIVFVGEIEHAYATESGTLQIFEMVYGVAAAVFLGIVFKIYVFDIDDSSGYIIASTANIGILGGFLAQISFAQFVSSAGFFFLWLLTPIYAALTWAILHYKSSN